MKLLLYIGVCVLFILSNVCSYKFGKFQQWMEMVEEYKRWKKHEISQKEGETIIAAFEDEPRRSLIGDKLWKR